MTREEEVQLLRKEIKFLDDRRQACLKNLRTVTVGRITAIINGLASPHYAHEMYLERRRKRATTRLRELLGQQFSG